MKFLICNGSLTPNQESNTYTLCEMVKLAFEKLNHECEIVTIRDLSYTPSTKDIDDDMRNVINKMFKVDGVIFATPIWWGIQSSYIQSVIERMDFIDSWSIENGYKPFYCKVFGTIVSGSGDGFQHIHGICYNFASMLGFTTPPGCNIESAAQGRDKILGDEETIGMVKTFATNMGVWAEALKIQKVKQQARHGVAYDLPESINEGKRIPRKNKPNTH
jgi:multimeric flavodoxin WrbA